MRLELIDAFGCRILEVNQTPEHGTSVWVSPQLQDMKEAFKPYVNVPIPTNDERYSFRVEIHK